MTAKLLSVCLITYNHEKYIRDAIEGVLMQKVDFDFDLIIADDCSTDGTRTIINEYKQQYPELIKLILQEKNVGPAKNHMDLITAPKSKYIALCDGDDYWTDPLKLQKQLRFLESNPKYVIHSGNAIQLSSDSTINQKTLANEIADSSFVLEDFLSNNNIVTSTVMYRNIKFQFPKYYEKVTFGDWFLYVMLMKTSGLKSYRSKEIYAVYRVHDKGAMSNLSELKICNTHISQIITVHKYLRKKLSIKEKDTLNYYFMEKYNLTLKEKIYLEALKTAWSNFRYCRFEMPYRRYLSELKSSLTN